MNQQAPEKPVEFMILQSVPLQSLKEDDAKNFTCAWRAMVKNAKKQKVGCEYLFSDGTVCTIVENPIDVGTEFRTIAFKCNLDETWFENNGHIPLPPYIKREDNKEDSSRYQNVYAKETGSAACPTAGLHFTQEILNKIQEKNIQIAKVTLNVGLGTFRPVNCENILEHKMHSEEFEIDEENAKIHKEKLDVDKRNGAIITKTYYIDISSDLQSGLEILSKLPGDRLSMCPNSISEVSELVSIYCLLADKYNHNGLKIDIKQTI